MESSLSKQSMDGLIGMIRDVERNYKNLNTEWLDLKRTTENDIDLKISGLCRDGKFKDYVLVHKDDLSQLATEITQLRQTLPKVIDKKYISSFGKLEALEQELESLKKSKELLEKESYLWKTRCETAITESQIEKQETLQLRCDLQDLSQQLSQQSDYCSSLGAACCTLLWRVSRKEEGIEAILTGTKVDEFFSIVTSTLDGYLAAYKDDWPSEPSDETNFILALCGTITNIAASAYGRNFIITNLNGRQLIDTFSMFIAEAPVKKSSVLKNLILMCLYNISINQKGLKYLTSKPDIMSLLTWHLQEESDDENRLNTLRIIQSLISDDNNINIIHQLQELLPTSYLHQLASDRDKNIQDIALEIIMDLRNTANES
ncbi:hypothetical protein LOTGIDRAFT_229909 [Lottia gigantea]|uniref:Heat shock factor 2-binding protein n=1 Tax=Lottia gigantea TaxID=225164 RepID=V4BFV5_LOTGI|nr:hypothetical protein LOTGIDRAFT_229909 [Lottia gigantea]ESP04797.1 hypothetical protein LOTGIDRAFT_229909 [Lottia gigantea]